MEVIKQEYVVDKVTKMEFFLFHQNCDTTTTTTTKATFATTITTTTTPKCGLIIDDEPGVQSSFMFTKKSKVGVTVHQEDGYYCLLNIVAVGGGGGPAGGDGTTLVVMEKEGVDLFCIEPSICLEEEGTTSLR